MKKYIMIAINLFSTLHSMDISHINSTNNSLNVWEFFSTPNSFDRSIARSPSWDQEAYNDDISINTLACLHILKNNTLDTNGLIILDAGCQKGHTSAFLAQNAKKVIAYDNNSHNMDHAKKKYFNSFKSLMFKEKYAAIRRNNFYDLVVSYDSPIEINELKGFHQALKPQGKLLCILTTQSNTLPLHLNILQEILPQIRNSIPSYARWNLDLYIDKCERQIEPLHRINTMLRTSGFDSISCEQQIFNILISSKQDKQNFIRLHQSLIMDLLPMHLITSPKKCLKLYNLYLGKLISKLKNDADDIWTYPIDTLALLLKKSITI